MAVTTLKNKKILVTGGSGFLGSAIVNELRKAGVKTIRVPRSANCDLRVWENCLKAVKNIDIVIHAAGNVGGIGYNLNNPGSLFYDNIIMGTQLMEAARSVGVEKFVSLGTICEYPKFTPVPFKEEDLWAGYPEETNAPYGLAKKMQIVQSQAYKNQYGFNAINLLPVNLYGPGDHFGSEKSHVIPDLIVKISRAKKDSLGKVELWGTGKPTREFLYVTDAAKGILLATRNYSNPSPVNLGAGFEISIYDLANKIGNLLGYQGKLVWDISKPDGQPRRKLDVTKARDEFGFKATTNFDMGLKKTIEWYVKSVEHG